MRRVAQKHGKIILTILGVVLMVTFALPTFNGNRDPGKIRVGTLNGGKVTLEDLDAPKAEIQILQGLGRSDPFGLLPLVLMLDKREPALHWYLLGRDAARFGFDSIPEIPDDQLNQYYDTPEVKLDTVLDRPGQRTALRSALHRGQMIKAYFQFLCDLPRPIARMEQLADDQFSMIQVSFATLDGSAGWEKMPEPSPEQIKAQFDAYKSVIAAGPLDPEAPLPPLPAEIQGKHLPFGYKYPDRVGVEYLAFSSSLLRDKIKPTDDDYKEAFNYYREHPEEFTSEPSTAVVGVKTKKSFDEVKEGLVQSQIGKRVDRLLDRLVERAMTQADVWRTASEEELKGKPLPDFKLITQDIARNRDVEGYAPRHVDLSNEFLAADALNKQVGIGDAVYEYPPTKEKFSFGRLATSIDDLVHLPKRTTLGSMGLQIGRPGPVLKDAAGNRYIYRIVKIDPSHEPKTLDEVRGQVVEDLKKKAAFEAANEKAKALAIAAAGNSLEKLATDAGLPFNKSVAFQRAEDQPVQALKHIRNFKEQAFTLVPAGSTTQPATPTFNGRGPRATTTLLNDDQLKVYVLQLLDVGRVNGEAFANSRRRLDDRMNFSQFNEMIRIYGYNSKLQELILGALPDATGLRFAIHWTRLETLMDRLKFVPDQKLPKPEEE